MYLLCIKFIHEENLFTALSIETKPHLLFELFLYILYGHPLKIFLVVQVAAPCLLVCKRRRRSGSDNVDPTLMSPNEIITAARRLRGLARCTRLRATYSESECT